MSFAQRFLSAVLVVSSNQSRLLSNGVVLPLYLWWLAGLDREDGAVSFWRSLISESWLFLSQGTYDPLGVLLGPGRIVCWVVKGLVGGPDMLVV